MSLAGRPTDVPATAAPSGHPVGAAVCTACALVCSVVRPGATGCDRGDEASALREAATALPHEAWIDGTRAGRAAAVATAAARLRAARRVLVTGLGGVTVEEARLACDLAESLGAAVAVAAPGTEGADVAGIARSGAITAAWEELRDRADLVLLWCHDPSPALPRFAERFLAPALPSGLRRTVLSVGAGAVGGLSGHLGRSVELPAGEAVMLARVLEARVAGRPLGTPSAHLTTAAGEILAAIDHAHCVAIVTGEDRIGAARAAVTGLLRALAPRVPAFEIPAVDGPPNAAGAEAVLAWRYGAAGDVPRAAPPALGVSSDCEFPFDASAAFRRGEFDAVLALGPVDGIEEAHGSPAAGVEIVAIDAVATRLVSRGVHLRCRDLSDTPGSVVRADGTTLALPGSPCDRPSVGDLLRSLHAEVAAGRGGSR